MREARALRFDRPVLPGRRWADGDLALVVGEGGNVGVRGEAPAAGEGRGEAELEVVAAVVEAADCERAPALAAVRTAAAVAADV